jgi:hypothetical protein
MSKRWNRSNGVLFAVILLLAIAFLLLKSSHGSGVENRIRLRCEVERSNGARHRIYSLPIPQSFPSLPFCPRFIQLPLKRIFRKPANFLPESNQLFVRHLAQSIPQPP